MHMADALVSPAVGLAFSAAGAGAIALSAARLKKNDLDEKTIPVMGVMGAFVFAAQMINFTIPGTGSSGHLGGGVLLAAMLGGGPALLTISAILIIQCLFFADGGLLALGCNIFNMGILPCFVVWPLIFQPIIRRGTNIKNITLASILASVAGLQLGAFSVVLQTTASGITGLPFSAFLLLMQPIHLAIGIAEGLITAAVLVFVFGARPDIIQDAAPSNRKNAMPLKRVILILGALAALIGGGLSLFASSNPDGLEWAIERVAGQTELPAEGTLHEGALAAQEKTALLPDYALPGSEDGTPAAGIIGGLMSCGLALATGACIRALRKGRKET